MKTHTDRISKPWTNVTVTREYDTHGNAYMVEHVSSGVVSDSWYKTLNATDQVKNKDRKRPKAQSYTRQSVTKMWGNTYVGHTDSAIVDLNQTGAHNWTPVGGVVNTFPDTSLYNTCLDRLYGQVRGELDLSIDLLQRKQTQQMITGGMRVLEKTRDAILKTRSIRGLIESSLKRDRYRGYNRQRRVEERAKRRQWSKDLADIHLQWTYGVKPTIESVYGLVEEFNTPQKSFLNVKARAKRVERVDFTSPYTPWGADFPMQVRGQNSKRYLISVDLALVPSVVDDLARFSSLNPASIIWETIPYSFVIDWVYDLGGYLRNLESALLYCSSFVSGYSTFTALEQCESTVSKGITAGTTVRMANLRGGYRYSRKVRTVLTGIPFPRPPRFEPKLGWRRLVNGAALARQLIR